MNQTTVCLRIGVLQCWERRLQRRLQPLQLTSNKVLATQAIVRTRRPFLRSTLFIHLLRLSEFTGHLWKLIPLLLEYLSAQSTATQLCGTPKCYVAHANCPLFCPHLAHLSWLNTIAAPPQLCASSPRSAVYVVFR